MVQRPFRSAMLSIRLDRRVQLQKEFGILRGVWNIRKNKKHKKKQTKERSAESGSQKEIEKHVKI